MTPLLLLLAISVKQDHTALRAGCAEDAETVAMLAAGAPVEIRFALSGESTPCYKVAIEQGGTTMEGYLSAAEIDGLDEFDEQRRSAAWVEARQQIMNALPANAGAALQAEQLIDASQPTKALEVLQPDLAAHRDPNLLALAGFAAWRADEAPRALEYWKQSLELRPNPDLERLYRRVERESRGDQSTEKLIGMRVALRYDPATVAPEAARQMVAVLDQDIARISAELGCSGEERITAIVQSQEAYRKTVDVAEWNAGQFDGRIRVPVMEGQGIDARLQRVFAHETVHACLATLGRWPAWFHEGLAQKLSGDTLSAAVREKLAAAEGKIPRLENLGQDWSRLDGEHAALAYAASLEAIEIFYENYAQLGIVNLLRNPERLAAITADLDKRLGL